MGSLVVRSERPEDADAIREVEQAAFGQPDEAAIVDASRGEPGWTPDRSLVAVDDGEAVGHLLLSPCSLDTPLPEMTSVEAIGPVAVRPDRQRAGVGSALMHAAIDHARSRGVSVLVLLGHPTYYPRFGFVAARPLGLLPPAAWPDEAWMALPLGDWRPAEPAVVRFPSAFGIG